MMRCIAKRFRNFKYKPGKTPTEIATRLTDLAGRWLKDCTTVEEVKDAVVKEQLLATLPEEVRMWVKERRPKTTTDAAQLAEDYFQARPAGTSKTDRIPTDPCPRCSTGTPGAAMPKSEATYLQTTPRRIGRIDKGPPDTGEPIL